MFIEALILTHFGVNCVEKIKIQPKILKGFRDYLPKTTIARTEMISRIKDVFYAHGLAPIDTPALEYAEILLGKGSEETDKQMFRFLDGGGRDVALRFDLTVPLARFAAMHIGELGTPFKRYHIAPVWRAEKPQRGRFREFIQCDFDIIGSRAMLADAEIVEIIHSVMNSLKVNHKIRLNNRLLLNGMLEKLQVKDKSTEVLRAVDKLEKIGSEGVFEALANDAGFSTSQAEELFAFLRASKHITDSAKLIEELKCQLSGSETGTLGINQVEELLSILFGGALSTDTLSIDLSIARGLDYYTGSVFETQIVELPDIGSVCSGGRYDNLAGLYTSQDLPGVGASVGLDRLLAALQELGAVSEKESTADVLITVLDEGSEPQLMALAQKIRRGGIAAELYPQRAKLGAQLKYADRKGIPFAIIAGNHELQRSVCCLKNLKSGEQKDGLSADEAAAHIKNGFS